jgi:hypothetical protein
MFAYTSRKKGGLSGTLLAVVLFTCTARGESPMAWTGAASLPVETTEQRTARYEAVAKRRAGTVVLVHRGAWAFAPENSLEALAAAMDYGADGCEVDLSRTADGVIVLFHDHMLDRLTGVFGRISEVTYAELQSLPLRDYHGRPTTIRVPTFVDLLILARQRAMLLFLDFKAPDMEREVGQLLDAMDMWNHIVMIGGVKTTARLREHPEFKRLPFKESLYIGRRDMDPKELRSALDKPGQMIFVEDPRPAATVMGREPYRPIGLPEGIRIHRGPLTTAPASSPDAIIAWRYMQNLGRDINAQDESVLIKLLAKDGRDQMPPNDEAALGAYLKRILKRAWAAQQLGERGVKSEAVVVGLVGQVKYRSLHGDWFYRGLDGALAIRALARLRATEAVPALIEALHRVDPNLEKLTYQYPSKNPISWRDFRIKKEIMPALGELQCDASKSFLLDYLAADEEKVRQWSWPQYVRATWALMRYPLTAQQMDALLGHARSDVRGTAIIECLAEPDGRYDPALEKSAAWALKLPRTPPRR